MLPRHPCSSDTDEPDNSSDPKSCSYGKHWTEGEVHAAFAPGDEAVRAVLQWLVDTGISHDRISHSHNKGWLAFDATTEEAENLFKAEHHEHEYSRGHWAVECDE